VRLGPTLTVLLAAVISAARDPVEAPRRNRAPGGSRRALVNSMSPSRVGSRLPWGLLGMLANTRAAERLFREGKGPDPATQDNATGGNSDGEIARLKLTPHRFHGEWNYTIRPRTRL